MNNYPLIQIANNLPPVSQKEYGYINRIKQLEAENTKLREQLRRHEPSEIPPGKLINVIVEYCGVRSIGFYSPASRRWFINGVHIDDSIGITGWYYLPGEAK